MHFIWSNVQKCTFLHEKQPNFWVQEYIINLSNLEQMINKKQDDFSFGKDAFSFVENTFNVLGKQILLSWKILVVTNQA